MNTSVFDSLESRLTGIPMQNIVKRAVTEETVDIIDWNKSQLQIGELADGTFLPPYKPATIKAKIKKQQQTAPMNLQDTGDFQGNFQASLDDTGVTLSSSDSKNATLVEKYGAIFGLTPNNTNLLKSKMIPLLIEDTRNFVITGSL